MQNYTVKYDIAQHRIGGVRGIPLALFVLLSHHALGELMPLPEDVFPRERQSAPKPIILGDKVAQKKGAPKLPEPDASEIPDAISIEARDAKLTMGSDDKSIRYEGRRTPIKITTDTGSEFQSKVVDVDMQDGILQLHDDLTIYSHNSLTRANSANFDWKKSEGSFTGVRIKTFDLLVKAKSGAYLTDEEGVKYMKLEEVVFSTHDIKDPSFWLGFEEMIIYPGDRFKAKGLSIGDEDGLSPVPLLSYIPISHSLNPKEGYLPLPGSRSIWGLYLLNRYGILLGNRRVENYMPTADYTLVTKVDYRELRGLGLGFDLEQESHTKKFVNATGLSLYYIDDQDPQNNPTSLPRPYIDSQRYRVAYQDIWEIAPLFDKNSHWRVKSNINVLSDSRFLSDFDEDLSMVNDKPDNTVALVKRNSYSEASVFMRFDPNNYYTTDERIEMSYYRARQPIKRSAISYETRNSISYMRQNVPLDEKLLYEQQLSQVTDAGAREYYTRLLNEDSYLRISSIHELTTSFKLAKIFNVVPKVGFAYNGYYGFQDLSDDTRFSAYFATDISMKMQRHFRSIRSSYFKIDGLTHIFQPYVSYSYHNMSSSDPLVPQVNAWTTSLGSSTGVPMPLDLNGYSGMDGWSDWSTVRLGFQNYLTTKYDGEVRRLLRWNTFFNINLQDNDTLGEYSNLYSVLEFRPSERLRIESDIQVPIIASDSDYVTTTHTVRYQALRWLEVELGHRFNSNDALQYESQQFNWRLNMRINENYSLSSSMYVDMSLNNIPLQQYSVFRNMGAWHMGGTLFFRDNGGVKETGFGVSFSLIETATTAPIEFF